MKLTKAGEKYLREKIMMYGCQAVIDNLDDPQCWQSWIQDAISARLDKSPDESVSFEIRAGYTKDRKPFIINLYDEHFFCGELMRYADGSYIRDATYTELCASDEAAENDNGVGAFSTEINGEKVTVYVQH